MDTSAILASSAQKYKSVKVDKPIPLIFDVGHLSASDVNDLPLLSSDSLQALTRDNTQLLVSAIFSLPTTSDVDGVYATLPDPVLRLPREKPLPKEKQLSRWENFAKVKGIQKKKTSNMVYDEGLKEYKPRFGYGSKHKLEDWAIEVDKNQDPNIDVRAEKKELEKEKKGMAQMKERRNQEEANAKNAGKNPKFVRKAQLEKQLTESKKATASLGKFDKTLVNDVKIKGVKRQKETSSVGNIALEKEVGMKLLKKIESGAKILNVNQAVKTYAKSAARKSYDEEQNNQKGRKKTRR